MKCVVCKSSDTVQVCVSKDLKYGVSREEFKIIRCLNCGISFTDPMLIPRQLAKFYPPYRKLETRSGVNREKYRFIKPFYKKGGNSLLDVGCNQGDFLFYLKNKGWLVQGVELSDHAAEIAAKKGLDIEVGDFVSMNLKKKYDVITFWHVLEHLSEPSEALAKARSLLHQTGHLILSVPNADSWQAKIFGKYWSGYDAPRHLFHFSPRSLKILLDKNGFSVIDINYSNREHNSPFIFYSLVAFLLRGRPLFGKGLESNYLKFSRFQRLKMKFSAFIARVGTLFFLPLAWLEAMKKHGGAITVTAVPKRRLDQAEISVGVMAYNEEKDIITVLNAIDHQKIHLGIKITEILVISDGSTDKTNQLVRKYAQTHPNVRLIAPGERLGKCRAINLFIKLAKNDIAVMANADNIPGQFCLQALLDALADPNVALAGPKAVCINSTRNFVGRLDHILWRMHHNIALRNPKMCGFLVFRPKIINLIPKGLILDESAMEFVVQSKKYKVKYVPDATLYLKGAENIREHIRQRKRNYVGYFIMKKINPGYSPSTLRLSEIFQAITNEISINPIKDFYILSLIFFEILSKVIAVYEFYILGATYRKWPMIKSSKGVKVEK